MDEKFKSELGSLLTDAGILQDCVCITGGAALSIIGLRRHDDVDVVIAPSSRSKLVNTSVAVKIAPKIEVVSENWGRVLGISDESLVCDSRYHFVVEGWKYVRPEIIFCKALLRRRDKDSRDLKLLERYAVQSEDWDWSLVKDFAFKRPASDRRLLSRLRRASGRIKRKTLDVIHTPGRFVGKFARARAVLRKRIADTFQIQRPPFRHQLVTKIATGSLLNAQFDGDQFARYDVLLRYLTARSILDGSETYRDAYMAMQRIRVDIDTYENFVDLVRSFAARGFRASYPIPVTGEGRLLNGAHRLACALAMEIEEVPIVVEGSNRKVPYPRNWFVNAGLDPAVLTAMDTAKYAVFERQGVLFPVILWPPMQPWFEEVISKIKSKYNVVWDRKITIQGDFEGFVKAIYSTDDIERWKVKFKVSGMRAWPPEICVIAVEIPNPRFRVKGRVSSYLSMEGEDIKRALRAEYGAKIDGYFYDIVCHIGDNAEHNREIFRVVRDQLQSN